MDYLASNIFYSGDEIKQSVNQLPKKLAEFYDKILTQILVQLDSRSIDRIRCILGWVAFAKRPLQKLEFLSAVTFSPGDPGVDRLVPQYMLDICGTLIEERRDSTLAFIHISVKEYLQSSSSNMVIQKQEALHEHGVATITCLLSGMRVFGSEFHEQERLLRVGKGLHGFHVYATEYWTEYLLSHASATDGSVTASPTPLIALACQLVDEVESSSSATVTGNDGETAQIKERVAPLQQYPTLSKHVGRALRARSLKNLESRILEGYASQGICEPPKTHPMSEGISVMLASYQNAVKSLLDYEQHLGLSGEELELFRAHFRTAAFTCRLESCPRATLGFETERLRFDHETSHVRCFPCKFPGCQYPPLASANALKNHTNKYHAPTIARKAIRKTGFERRWHDTSHPRMAQRTHAPKSSPQPQPQHDQISPRTTLESDGDDEHQSRPFQPLPRGAFRRSSRKLFHPPKLELMKLRHNTREQSIITVSSDSETQDPQMAGSAHEQQPHERSPLMKTTKGPSSAIPDDQESPSQRLPEGYSARRVPLAQ